MASGISGSMSGILNQLSSGGGTPPTAITLGPVPGLALGGSMGDMNNEQSYNFSCFPSTSPIGGVMVSTVSTCPAPPFPSPNYNWGGSPSPPPFGPGVYPISDGILTVFNDWTKDTTEILFDTAQYVGPSGWSAYGPPGAWPEIYNYGACMVGGTGATSWSWALNIVVASFANGLVPLIQGTANTAQDCDFGNFPGTIADPAGGIGEYIFLMPGRAGFVAAGDSMVIEVTGTATNASGSVNATWTIMYTWV